MYEVKIKINRVTDSGSDETVNIGYVVNAVSFGDVEMQIATLLEGAEYQITQIKLSPYDEYIVDNEKQRYFKIVLTVSEINENTGKAKKIKYNFLVGADEQKEAVAEVERISKDVLSPWEVTALNETNIVSVI